MKKYELNQMFLEEMSGASKNRYGGITWKK